MIFGNDVYEIEDSAFKNCGNLSSFKLNRNIRKLGSQSFSGCSGIVDIDLSGNIFDEIGESVFSGLGIKTLKTQLASRSFGAFDIFSNCIRLSSADIRSNFIPSGCFAYCPNLKSAKFTFSNIITR